ncbi:MAG: glycoside hydrolase family 127 protein [Dysgonamonadaceae bacterium]|nr:glycoside hydrolase family 127 protein [Dysgonamonadaceae bacterium]
MKTTAILSIIVLSTICSVSANNYVKNKAPLAETPFTALPLGAVRAEGWLLKQLQLQKEGLTGHAESLYSGDGDLGAHCDWLGGEGDSWERAPYYVKGLVALAHLLNDEELKAKARKWINWSIDSQQKRTGYFGPANNHDWWARMPMLYAIRDHYDATGDDRVIPFFTNYFKYQNANIATLPLSSWGKSRAGDNIEIVLWLYNRTGDAFLLELADKLHGQAYPWTDIYTNNLFNRFGTDFQPKHNVNVPQAMKMPAIYYQKSQSPADRDAYLHGREHLLCNHGQPQGMQSGNEMLAGKSSLTGLELCSVVEQMQSSETVQMILGDAGIGDQLEKIAFNALPGALTNDIKGLQYYQQANQVISKHGYYAFAQAYDNGNMPGPYSGYGCCRFDFHMGWPYFVKTMWAATSDNGLAAMAYGPCTVTALVEDSIPVTVNERTNYPFDEQLTFTVSLSKATPFPLKFRIPAWCKSPQVKVNGTLQDNVEAGAFYVINRTWSDNDVVSLDFPMSIQLNEEVNKSVSVQRGPLVYSLKIEENRSVFNEYGDGFREYQVFPTSAWNYALLIDNAHPETSIRVNTHEMSDNPFAEPPLTLSVSARQLPAWTLSHNDRIATDPPFSPVESSEATETITLVPYGSETLRVTCLPYIGRKAPLAVSFTEDFSGGQAGWVQYGGSFDVKDGTYVAGNWEAGHPCSKSVYPGADFSDFTCDAQVQVNGNGDGGLMFRAGRLSFGPDEYSGYYAGISSSGQKVELGKANGTWTSLRTASMNVSANRWHQIRITAQGTNIKIYVDDMTTPKIDFHDASFSSGAIGVRAYNALAAWDNISVRSLSETNIQTEKTSDNIRLYPNPATTNLSITVPQNGRLSMFDSAGKHLFTGSVLSGTTTLNISNYETGVYFIKIITNTGTSCARFIKTAGLTAHLQNPVFRTTTRKQTDRRSEC